MVSDWKEITIGEFATLQRGFDLPEGERKAGRIPILGSFGITGSHNVAGVKGPGVTVGRSGASFGVATYSEGDYWPLNTALFVKDFHSNNEKFVYYFFKTFDFSHLNSGSAQPSLNRNVVHPIKIRIPSRTEQDAIAKILSSLDDKIELNRRKNVTLEAMARAFFNAWFVDFEPVHANMENRASTSAAPEIAKLFPSEFENGVPKGWVRTTFAEIVKEENQKNKEKRDLQVLSAIQTGELVKSADFFNKQVFSAQTAKYKVVKPSNYAFNPSRINIGSIGLNIFEEDGLVSPVYVVFSVRQGFADWLGFHIRSEQVKNHINVLATGTVRQNLTYKDFSSIPLTLPNIEIVRAFGDLHGRIEGLRKARIREIETLTEIRDSLLPRLISGKLRVGEFDRNITEEIG